VEALLSCSDIPVESTHVHQGFFTAKHLQAIYYVESWAMSPQTQNLVALPLQTFHIYSILQCLPNYQFLGGRVHEQPHLCVPRHT
jgi:hypothetical protein